MTTFSKFLFLLVCCFFEAITFRAFGAAMNREVEIELDAIEGAKSYEIKIEPAKGTPGKPLIEKSETPQIKVPIPLGHWRIQSRSFDKRNVPGQWMDLGTLDILFKPPTLLLPAKDTIIRDVPISGREVTFSWESFSAEASYELKITKSTGDVLQTITVTGQSEKIQLEPGDYTWSMRSLVPDLIELDGKDPESFSFRVVGSKLSDPILIKPEKSPPKSLSWKEVQNASGYHVEFTRTKDASNQELSDPEIIINRDQPETELPLPQLESGTYQLRVTATAKHFESSKERKLTFKVKIPKPHGKDGTAGEQDIRSIEKHYKLLNLAAISIGPVFWQYNLSSDSGQSYNLEALTFTATAADASYWFSKNDKRAWGLEARGRQTNVSLFQPPPDDLPNQSPITVADRRLGILLRYRKIIDRVGIDAILGAGGHHYTYLVTDTSGLVNSSEGNLLEYYLGGSADWRLTTGHRAQYDLTFHPIASSIGISAVKSLQMTSTLRFLENVLAERVFLNWSLEYFRSRVTVTSAELEGEGITISTWYRLGLGLAVTL